MMFACRSVGSVGSAIGASVYIGLGLLSIYSVPSRAITIAEPVIDYSEFVFFGASLFNYWLCFKPNEAAIFPTETGPCIEYATNYFDDPSHIPIKCTSTSDDAYCTSAFQSLFPGALNFAIGGLTIRTTNIKLQNYAPLQALSRGEYPNQKISYIVFQIGNNDVDKLDIDAFLPAYKSLLDTAHSMFPSANILLMGITPRQFPCDDIITINAILDDYFNTPNNTEYPFVVFVNLLNYWYPDGKFDSSAFYDKYHQTTIGYGYLAQAIKDNVWKILG